MLPFFRNGFFTPETKELSSRTRRFSHSITHGPPETNGGAQAPGARAGHPLDILFSAGVLGFTGRYISQNLLSFRVRFTKGGLGAEGAVSCPSAVQFTPKASEISANCEISVLTIRPCVVVHTGRYLMLSVKWRVSVFPRSSSVRHPGCVVELVPSPVKPIGRHHLRISR